MAFSDLHLLTSADASFQPANSYNWASPCCKVSAAAKGQGPGGIDRIGTAHRPAIVVVAVLVFPKPRPVEEHKVLVAPNASDADHVEEDCALAQVRRQRSIFVDDWRRDILDLPDNNAQQPVRRGQGQQRERRPQDAGNPVAVEAMPETRYVRRDRREIADRRARKGVALLDERED